MKKKAVVVLSGGLDSTTCMGMAEEAGYDIYPMTFHYGQRHNREVLQAEKVANYYRVNEHKVVDISFLGTLGGSALTDESTSIPDGNESDEIPATYVPARNMIFLSLASAFAEVIGAEAVFIGVSAVDYSGYPDCRPEFIESMNQTVNLATKAGVTDQPIKIEAPLSLLTKAETVKEGRRLNVPYHLTTSCYHGDEQACGKCDSCLLRIKGFKEAGHKDPITYQVDIDWAQ